MYAGHTTVAKPARRHRGKCQAVVSTTYYQSKQHGAVSVISGRLQQRGKRAWRSEEVSYGASLRHINKRAKNKEHTNATTSWVHERSEQAALDLADAAASDNSGGSGVGISNLLVLREGDCADYDRLSQAVTLLKKGKDPRDSGA
ncbi:hypothetical protein HPB50_027489 [Hyalomma asiaticum]|uniref:Uncharacterized protein n=1 Tax=Hyalomma asiaticum TaxID=266040 RepID=A0ACB7T5A1_HYAAI|nr:hypothetical protein HPB50_027489 [Hyalomma asiaticum]